MVWDRVVNCSRFVSLKYWTQLIKKNAPHIKCCELLSICIFEILNTATSCNCHYRPWLWIALDLYLWNIEHSFLLIFSSLVLVVNCSRFVSLKYWTQPSCFSAPLPWCCELLSICIFEILNTARGKGKERPGELWIALDLYLWNIEHSACRAQRKGSCVVNCSRFVSLKYWTQLDIYSSAINARCELLSICIFEILNTALPG